MIRQKHRQTNAQLTLFHGLLVNQFEDPERTLREFGCRAIYAGAIRCRNDANLR